MFGVPKYTVNDGVVDGNHSIPLNSMSFGGSNRSYGKPMMYFYYPQSLVRIRGANWEIRIWIWRSSPAGCCSSQAAQAEPV
jgi:hypothetical protein